MMMHPLHHVLVPEMSARNAQPSRGRSHERYPDSSQDAPPIIGIPLPVQQGTQGPLLLADALGAWAIERMGGRIFLVPLWPFPTHPHLYQSLWTLTQLMDGVFLPGGIQGTGDGLDEPRREPEAGPQLWPLSWERALAQLATALGMPILAVAEGAHAWNRALGGTSRAVPTTAGSLALHTAQTWEPHPIRVRAHSMLASLLQPALASQDGEPVPWELLLQAKLEVEHLAPGLRPCAQARDERVVAFERRDGPFGLGITGRLERGLDHVYGTTIVEAFLQACRAFARWREDHPGGPAARDLLCTTLYERVTQRQPVIPFSQGGQQEPGQPTHPLCMRNAGALPASDDPVGQERLGPGAHPPTKAELNRIRRQRWKNAR
jgi:gamma-glutamyl-gamma-aminobutyrate hydrolase PuuD